MLLSSLSTRPIRGKIIRISKTQAISNQYTRWRSRELIQIFPTWKNALATVVKKTTMPIVVPVIVTSLPTLTD